MADLVIRNLHAKIADSDKEILRGIDLEVSRGEIHAIMGPNGSGKSTLSHVLMGHPGYEVTAGDVTFDGTDVLELEADERSKLGLFLCFQYPYAVPGVTVANFLRTAVNAHRDDADPDPGVPEADGGGDEAARGRQEDVEPLPERRVLRRREEAPRDPAAGDAEAVAGDPRRDRLGPRHRRAPGRRARA